MSHPTLPNGLTVKQEAFSQGVAVEGLSATAAYRKAYDTNGDPSTQERDAFDVIHSPKVAARIQELQQRIAILADINLASVASELDDARRVARQAEVPQTSAMIAATKLKANLVGLLQPQVSVESKSVNINATIADMTVEELRALIAVGDQAEVLESGRDSES